MKPRLVEANPLVEENKNQIAVMRGLLSIVWKMWISMLLLFLLPAKISMVG